jgi:hypothetical protein
MNAINLNGCEYLITGFKINESQFDSDNLTNYQMSLVALPYQYLIQHP